MHEGAEVEDNRKMEKNGPGRQRWKINQRNIKSRQKTYAAYGERMNILGLEKSMQYLKKIDCKPEDYGKQSYIIFE
jgi:helix-turn-helix protein